MSVDVREGDVLVVSATDYPIVSCAEWVYPYSMAGMRRLTTVTASTKRTHSGGPRHGDRRDEPQCRTDR